MTVPFTAVVLDSFGATLNSAGPADRRLLVQCVDGADGHSRGRCGRRVGVVLPLVIGGLLAVSGAGANGVAPRGLDSLRVTRVDPASYRGSSDDGLRQACAQWRLSEEQVRQFFLLSDEYDDEPYSRFYQIPCSISGDLEVNGTSWTFVIGGGATATWERHGDTRHWGCSAEACASMVLLPTDGMNPE